MRRKCPTCRATIPPSKEMVTTLLMYRARKQELEDRNETSSEEYHRVCRLLKEAEERVGADWDGVTVLQDKSDKPPVIMPDYIFEAIGDGDIKMVIRWINANQAEDRANAISSAELRKLSPLFISATGHSTLMTLLLQLGADVDFRAIYGGTALGIMFSGSEALNREHANKGARLLLSWGASFFLGGECSREFTRNVYS